MELSDIAQAFKAAIPNWDPAKHPRDRLGQFLEVGDYVHAYSGPGVLSPEATGKVAASYYDVPTNRMFIGIDVGAGQLKWYRPKQLENVAVKASLESAPTPDLPLPSVESKVDQIEWDEVLAPTPAALALPAESTALHLSDLTPEFKKKIGLETLADKPEPSVVQPDTVIIPAGKTPEDMLALIVTSYENKLAKSADDLDSFALDPAKTLADFKAAFQMMLDDPDHDSAEGKLNKLMTAAKLGGKQRKRYKSILAQKHGGHQAAKVTAPAEQAPAKGSTAWLIGNGHPSDSVAMVLKKGSVHVIEPNGTIYFYTPGGKKSDTSTLFDPPSLLDIANYLIPDDDGKPYAEITNGQALWDELTAGSDDEVDEGVMHPWVAWLNHVGDGWGSNVMVYANIAGGGSPSEVWIVDGDVVTHWTPAGGMQSSELTPEKLSDLTLDGAISAVYDSLAIVDPDEFTPTPDFDEPDADPTAEDESAATLAAPPAWAVDVAAYLSGENVYTHPQGSVIVVQGDSVTKYGPDGKKKSTSATAQNLADGHGGWTWAGYGSAAFLEAATPKSATGWTIKKAAAKKTTKKAAAAPSVPAGVITHDAAVVAASDKVLSLLSTTLANKGLWDINSQLPFDSMMSAPTYDAALTQLNKLAGIAKLGGNQRKRYRQALQRKYGMPVEGTATPQLKPAPITFDDGGVPVDPSSISTWRKIVPGSGSSSSPSGVTGATQANNLVNPAGVAPPAAKHKIQIALSERMAGKVTKDQLIKSVLDTSYSYGGDVIKLAHAAQNGGQVKVVRQNGGNWVVNQVPPGGDVSTPELIEQALRETVINTLISLWAGTSNDNNPRSLAMQEAATKEFGLKNVYPWHAVGGSVEELQKHEALFRTFLREMYNETQDWAKKNGVTRVRLRRGVKTHIPVAKGGVAEMQLRPMSSFSSSGNVASNFGGGKNVVEAYVPIEWVVGTAATGFGCKNEFEWVVLGGIHEVRRI